MLAWLGKFRDRYHVVDQFLRIAKGSHEQSLSGSFLLLDILLLFKFKLQSSHLLYARVLFFCEVNNNKNAKEYLCLGLLR